MIQKENLYKITKFKELKELILSLKKTETLSMIANVQDNENATVRYMVFQKVSVGDGKSFLELQDEGVKKFQRLFLRK